MYRAKVREFCRNGHPLSGDNLYVIPSSGQRTCRICQGDYHRSQYSANSDMIRIVRRRRYRLAKAPKAVEEAAVRQPVPYFPKMVREWPLTICGDIWPVGKLL